MTTGHEIAKNKNADIDVVGNDQFNGLLAGANIASLNLTVLQTQANAEKMKLAEVSSQKTEKRFLEKLRHIFARNPKTNDACSEPDFHYVANQAITDAIRMNDEVKEDFLIDLIKERALTTKTLYQMAINEAISSIREIPQIGLDLLSISFILNRDDYFNPQKNAEEILKQSKAASTKQKSFY